MWVFYHSTLPVVRPKTSSNWLSKFIPQNRGLSSLFLIQEVHICIVIKFYGCIILLRAMKEYLYVLADRISNLFDDERIFFTPCIIATPFIVGLLGPAIELFEQGIVQEKIKILFKKISRSFAFRRRKLRPARNYFKESFATIRTLF